MKFIRTALKLLLCYLLAGMTCILYFGWPDYQGNPDIPFSGFPEMLIWSPMAPLILFDHLTENLPVGLIGLALFSFTFIAMLWLFFRKQKQA
jgi:hypothetical protein